MAKNNNLTDFLTDVANAIREKKGTTEKINPQDFANEIANLPTNENTEAKDDYIYLKVNATEAEMKSVIKPYLHMLPGVFAYCDLATGYEYTLFSSLMFVVYAVNNCKVKGIVCPKKSDTVYTFTGKPFPTYDGWESLLNAINTLNRGVYGEDTSLGYYLTEITKEQFYSLE